MVCYGADLAWIGMVLTLPEFRGRGLARKLMEHSIAYCERRGVGWAKLDATDMGAPIYAKLGFEPECAVERCLREPEPVSAEGGTGRVNRNSGWTGGRSERTAARCWRRWRPQDAAAIPGEAFAMGRPGSARGILRSMCEQVDGMRASIVGVVPCGALPGAGFLGPAAGEPGRGGRGKRIRLRTGAAAGADGQADRSRGRADSVR